jgi:hypothetical protein
MNEDMEGDSWYGNRAQVIRGAVMWVRTAFWSINCRFQSSCFVLVGVLLLIGCAATTPPGDDFAGRATEKITVDCPYLRVQVVVGEYEENAWGAGVRTKRRQDSLAQGLRTRLDQIGFEIVYEPESANWVIYSNAVELPDKKIFWSISMQKLPTVTDDGILLFRPGSVITTGGKSVEFTSTSHLVITGSDEVDDAIAGVTNDIAKKWLPSAQVQCADMEATLFGEAVKLERLREQLVDEIERIQRIRSEQSKQLELEVEP